MLEEVCSNLIRLNTCDTASDIHITTSSDLQHERPKGVFIGWQLIQHALDWLDCIDRQLGGLVQRGEQGGLVSIHP